MNAHTHPNGQAESVMNAHTRVMNAHTRVMNAHTHPPANPPASLILYGKLGGVENRHLKLLPQAPNLLTRLLVTRRRKRLWITFRRTNELA